jgi:predicted metalloprotease with PDZ domain
MIDAGLWSQQTGVESFQGRAPGCRLSLLPVELLQMSMRVRGILLATVLSFCLPVNLYGQVEGRSAQPGQGAAAAATDEVSISYRVDLTHPGEHQILVSVELVSIEAAELILELPAWAPRHQTHRFGRNLSEVRAEGPENLQLPVERIGLRRWRVATDGVGTVTVHYRAYANTPGPFEAQLDPAHAYLNPASILMYAPHYLDRPVTIEFEAPPSWRVATALEPTFDPTVFRASSYGDIVSGPIQVSRHQERFAVIRGMNITLAFSAVPSGLDLSEFLQLLEPLIANAIDLFGVLPASDHWFLFHFPDTATRASIGTGRVTAVHWGMQGTDGGVASLLQLTLRAFIEAWLGGRIRPSAQTNASYREPFVTDSLWFLDGGAEYLSELLMVRSGLKPTAAFFDRMGAEITELQNTPARTGQSAAEASQEVWFRDDEWYRTPERSLDHRNKGFLLAFLLDVEMRAYSGNERSLDDLMAFLASYHNLGGGGFAESRDILLTASALSRAGLGLFLREYVLGTAELPYTELLQKAGWTLRPVPEEIATTGFTTDLEGTGILKVTSVEDESSAALAGLLVGDRIVAVNGSFLVGSLLDVVAVSRPGDVLTLRVQRGAREDEISFPLGEGSRRAYVVEPLANPTPEQRAITRALLGTPPN